MKVNTGTAMCNPYQTSRKHPLNCKVHISLFSVEQYKTKIYKNTDLNLKGILFLKYDQIRLTQKTNKFKSFQSTGYCSEICFYLCLCPCSLLCDNQVINSVLKKKNKLIQNKQHTSMYEKNILNL